MRVGKSIESQSGRIYATLFGRKLCLLRRNEHFFSQRFLDSLLRFNRLTRDQTIYNIIENPKKQLPPGYMENKQNNSVGPVRLLNGSWSDDNEYVNNNNNDNVYYGNISSSSFFEGPPNKNEKQKVKSREEKPKEPTVTISLPQSDFRQIMRKLNGNRVCCYCSYIIIYFFRFVIGLGPSFFFPLLPPPLFSSLKNDDTEEQYL